MAEIVQNEGHEKGGKKRPKKGHAHIDMTPMVDLMCLLITFFMLTTAFSKPKVMEIVLPEKKPPTDKTEGPKVPKKRTLNVLITDKSAIYWYIGIYNPADKEDTIPHFYKAAFDPDAKNCIRKTLLLRNKEVFVKIDELKENVKKGVVKSQTMLEGFKKDSLVAFIKAKVTLTNIDTNFTKRSKEAIIDNVKKAISENDIMNLLIQNEIKKIKSSDEQGPIVLIKADKEKAKYKDFVSIIDEMAIANIARYAVVDPTDLELKKLNALLSGADSY
ncbi:MAG: biopolymer transporter ExbD [Bacteroidia bacterium]|nr:biopolymer transporter ExbD [Bacteroidia bacterium]